LDQVSDTPEEWPVHRSETIWSRAPFTVRQDHISAPARPDEQFARLVVEHPGAVVVLAVDTEQRALVLHQYRHPTGRRFAELPAGLLDVAHEDPLAAARRELLEEGMLRAGSWSHLLSTYPSPGLSSERMEIYLAEDLSSDPERGGFVPSHEEADMSLSWVPVKELVDGVLERRLTDGPLGMAVMAYALRHL
jgi:ADP-ribose pyrophosphatase